MPERRKTARPRPPASKPAAAPARGREATSTDLAREVNRDLILELIRRHQPVSRIELARISRLQNSTVSSIAEQLLGERWIRETKALRTARGRRPTQITLNPAIAILAIDVRPGCATVALVDLNGELGAREQLALPAEAEAATHALAKGIDALRSRHPELTFLGAGLCLPGRVNAGQLTRASELPWLGFDLQTALSEATGLAIEVENDASSSLLGELWFGSLAGQPLEDAVLLNVSAGIGAALLADGNLVSGRLGLAGELGHLAYNPAGPACTCGRHGCWQLYAGTAAALEHYRQLLPNEPVLRYPELAALARDGNAEALAALERQAEALGRGLRAVTAALDPEAILFAGELLEAWPLVEPTLGRLCQAGMLGGTAPPRLAAIASAPETAHLRGAAAVVLQRHRSYYRARSTARAANLHGVRPEPA